MSSWCRHNLRKYRERLINLYCDVVLRKHRDGAHRIRTCAIDVINTRDYYWQRLSHYHRRAESFCTSRQSLSCSGFSQRYVDYDSSFPCSQKRATCPNHKSEEANPYEPILFLQDSRFWATLYEIRITSWRFCAAGHSSTDFSPYIIALNAGTNLLRGAKQRSEPVVTVSSVQNSLALTLDNRQTWHHKLQYRRLCVYTLLGRV
jgi:hypothetical protein